MENKWEWKQVKKWKKLHAFKKSFGFYIRADGGVYSEDKFEIVPTTTIKCKICKRCIREE